MKESSFNHLFISQSPVYKHCNTAFNVIATRLTAFMDTEQMSVKILILPNTLGKTYRYPFVLSC